MAEAPKVIHFSSKALPEDTLLVARLAGREEISRLYRFELDLVSKKADVDFAKVLKEPAALGLKAPVRLRDGGVGTRLLKIGGMVAAFSQEEKKYEWVRYRATFVPRLWRTTLTVQSRIFLEKNVQGVVEEVLKGAGFGSKDYEFKLSGTYPKREYVVQYQESDFNFISRWLEHEGIFYYFEQTDDGDKVVFCDATSHYAPLAGVPKVPYRPIAEAGGRVAEEGASDWFKEDVVQSLSCRQGVIPKEVVLQDYNYETPSKDLKVTEPVVPDGVGHVYEYGTHYRDTDEGKALAKVRSEEIKCRQRVFTGASDHKAFRAGAKFQLAEHYRGDFNADYLLVEVDHRAEQALGLPWSTRTGTVYGNRFVAIPATKEAPPFRPERLTRWPRIRGVLNAKVDTGDPYAEIDKQGRYKVKLPMDLSDRKDGKASLFIRLAEPYAGSEYGTHWPLHKGTEVLLTHENGDPDRPVIAAAVPNPDTKSPVTADNHSQSVVRTAGKNEITMEDSKDHEYLKIVCPRYTSNINLGHGVEGVPGGIVANTEEGVSINAGKDVFISSGQALYGADQGSIKSVNKAISWMSFGASIASAASANVAERLATGHTAWAALLADAAGVAAGAAGKWAHTNTYITSPTKVAAMAGGELFMASGAAIDCVALGSACFMGGAGAVMIGGGSASVVGGGDAELISMLKDCKIDSKRKDVDVEAHKNVLVKAETENVKIDAAKKNVVITAQKDMLLATGEGKAEVLIDQDLTVESVKKKKITIKTGKSSIVLEENKITIDSPEIVIKTKPDNLIHLDGSQALMRRKDKKVFVDDKGTHVYTASKGMYVQSSQVAINGSTLEVI